MPAGVAVREAALEECVHQVEDGRGLVRVVDGGAQLARRGARRA